MGQAKKNAGEPLFDTQPVVRADVQGGDDAAKLSDRLLRDLFRISQSASKTLDLDEMIREVVGCVFDIFKCDRSWLLYPLDPEAETYSVPFEKTHPDYPGALKLGKKIKIDPPTSILMKEVLRAGGPLVWGPDNPFPAGMDIVGEFNVKSMMISALRPKIGKPWAFGMHQCFYERVWTEDEKRLFKFISHKVSDTLTQLLLHRELKESENRLAVALKGADLGFWDWNVSSGSMVYDSHLAELIGCHRGDMPDFSANWNNLVHPDDLSRVKKAVSDHLRGKTTFYECEHRIKAGKLWKWVQVRGRVVERNPDNTPCRVSGTLRDITRLKEEERKRRRLEEQLRQSQKMEALGTLAGGIAHDFNNILQAIDGYLDLALSSLDDKVRASDFLNRSLKASSRARKLVEKILSYSRRTDPEKKIVNLNYICKEVSALLKASLPPSVYLEVNCSDDLPHILCDETEIHQVVMNLCSNAAKALNGKEGTIEIRTKKAELEFFGEVGTLPAGCYALLEVKDNGRGIHEHTLSRIFDPFFTTAEVGEGTGLGLSVVYSIVNGLGGGVDVESRIGKGSVFKVYLPIAEAAVQEQGRDGFKRKHRGLGRILVVDDEKMLVDLECERLESLGYQVDGASRCDEALEVFSRDPQRYQLVLADYMMPDCNGIELAEEIKKIRSDIPVLLMTGNERLIPNTGIMRASVAGVLSKPHSWSELAGAVSKALS